MKVLIAAILLLAAYPADAQSVCEAQYSLCMSACATDKQPERCMQKCAPMRPLCPELMSPLDSAPYAEGSAKPKKKSRK